MLEYFSFKKVINRLAKKKAVVTAGTPLAQPTPVLTDADEIFLQRIISAEGHPPPLPERPNTLESGNGNLAGNSLVDDNHKGKAKEDEEVALAKKSGRFSFLLGSSTKKKKADGLHPDVGAVPPSEAIKEEDDIIKVLEDLNLSATNNRVFCLSTEFNDLVQKFTIVLKDIINGIPTAYDDLVRLLDDYQRILNKNYESLPDFIKRLITQLPEKVKNNLTPELQAAAKGVSSGTSGSSFRATAKSFLTPISLQSLVTKPGAIISLLKAIMNALKLRWPAFMGTNLLLSLALFVLLFVLWYCHKRGKDARQEREAKADSEGRIVELEDDIMLQQEVRPKDMERNSTEKASRE